MSQQKQTPSSPPNCPPIVSPVDLERLRTELQADAAATGPNDVSDAPFSGIAEGDVLIPADPSPTDREALLIHAEILAMQARWGISYKDAAHRLYLVEVEKFRVAKHAENAITSLRDRIENCITHDISPVIKYIDSPAFHLPTPRDLEEKFRRYQS